MAEAVSAFIFQKALAVAYKLGASKALAIAAGKTAVFVTKVGLTIGASAALSAALAPRTPRPDSRISQRQATPERISAFGRVRGAGAYVLYEAAGGDSVDVLAIHDGRIAGFDAFYLHDDPVTTGTGPLGAGFVQGHQPSRQYYEHIYVDTRPGTASQTAFTRARQFVPAQWTVNHRLTGVAALELLCRSPKASGIARVYPLGLPRPSVVYRAQYCFDFRNSGQSADNWEGWTPGSRNPVLQLATFLINPPVPDPAEPDRCLGLGEDFDAIIAPHLADWIAAASACDDAVARKEGGTEPRYTCDFEYFVGEDPADTMARLLASCDGWMSETGDGGLTIRVGKYTGPDATLDNDWVLDFAIRRGQPDESLKNVFVGFFTDPAKKFARVEGEPWFDAGSIALTGVRRYEPVELTQVQSHGQLRRLLKRLAKRRNAEARGTLRLDLPALDLLGKRWIQIPEDFPDSEFLRGKVIEVEDIEIDLTSASLTLDWALFDGDADTWDPASEEGTPPPPPSQSGPGAPPVIEASDIVVTIETGERFGGTREAYAVLYFPAPVRSYDLAGAGTIDVPRTDLGWMVRWRRQSGGAWTEQRIDGDVITGNSEDGYEVRLETAALPRAALFLQVASIGARDEQGEWSDNVAADVEAATAPALPAPQNVTASAALEADSGGARRPALTVGFDPITDPQAQLVIIALKAPGAPDAEFAQVDAVEPRLGGKTSFNIPIGVTRDIGLQVWSQWRAPSEWAVVPDVVIPEELIASDAVAPSAELAAARDVTAAGFQTLAEAKQYVADLTGGITGLTQAEAIEQGYEILRQSGVENLILMSGDEGGDLIWRVRQSEARLSFTAHEDFNGALAEREASTAGQTITLYLARADGSPASIPWSPKGRAQVGVHVALDGVAVDPVVRVLAYDADGAELDPAELDEDLNEDGSRYGGLVEPLDHPTGPSLPGATRRIGLEVEVAASAGGAFVLEVSRPLVGMAPPGLQEVAPWQPGNALDVRRVVTQKLADITRARELRQAEFQGADSQARASLALDVSENTAAAVLAASLVMGETVLADALTQLKVTGETNEAGIIAVAQALSAASVALGESTLAEGLTLLTARVEETEDGVSALGESLSGTQAQVGELDAITTLLQQSLVDTTVTPPVLKALIVLLAEAAGADPAYLSILSGAGGRAALVAPELVFGEPTQGGGILVAMRIIDQIVHVMREIRMGADGAYTIFIESTPVQVFGKDPTTGKRGLFIRKSNGDPLLIINADDQVFQLYPDMAIDGFGGVEQQHQIGRESMMQPGIPNTNPVLADFRTRQIFTSLSEGNEPIPQIAGARVHLRFFYEFEATADIFDWYYWRVRIQRWRANGTGTALATIYDGNRLWNVSQSTGGASGNAASQAYPISRGETIEVFDVLPTSTAETEYIYGARLDPIASPGNATTPVEGFNKATTRIFDVKQRTLLASAPRPGVFI